MGDPNRAVFKAVQNMLERHRNSEYFFYGDEERNTPCEPVRQFPGITNLVELFSVLECCWCEETASPSCKKDWTAVNPSYGHDCFNKLNDNYVDLTSEQFDLYGILVDYEKNRRMTRDYCFIKEETVARYKQLQRNIIYYLTQYEDDFWED